jgi:S-adenosylmethionine hydrolase
MPRTLVTLTTDFGQGSPYVAQMKGVLLRLCPDAEIVDITHGISPQKVRQAAIVLADVTPWFPTNTLHVAVIDPGVGTTRRLIYAEIGDQRYLAPDNGSLSRLSQRATAQRVIALENRRYFLPEVSSTFHGRDILAPVAAHLLQGADPGDLGPPLRQTVELHWPHPHVVSDRLVGEILYVDSFGNLISDITAHDLAARPGDNAQRIVECAGRQIHGIQATYGVSQRGDIVALLDSHGRLEIAAVNDNAAKKLDAHEGTPILVY